MRFLKGLLKALAAIASVVLTMVTKLVSVFMPDGRGGGEWTQQARQVQERVNNAVAQADTAVDDAKAEMTPAKSMARVLYNYCRAVAAQGTPRERPLPSLDGLGGMAEHVRRMPKAMAVQVAQSGPTAAHKLFMQMLFTSSGGGDMEKPKPKPATPVVTDPRDVRMSRRVREALEADNVIPFRRVA